MANTKYTPINDEEPKNRWVQRTVFVALGVLVFYSGTIYSNNTAPVATSIVRGSETQTCLGYSDETANWCWDLTGGNGPWCPDWSSSAREAAEVQGHGGSGWDPCCYDVAGGCNGMGWIAEAVYDYNAQKWCSHNDYVNGGNACGSNYWTGGYVYDHCPCGGDDYYNCDTKTYKKQRCVPYFEEGGEHKPDSFFKGMCGDGKDICTGGYANSLYADGTCLSGHHLSHDYNQVPECWPDNLF